MLSELGLIVAREIPVKYLVGIAKGQLTVHGGVVRNLAGQIAGHLAIPGSSAISTVAGRVPGVGTASSLVANMQLVSLSRDVQKVLNLSMANTALAGLGLATSIVGFVYLTARINQIDRKLDELTEDVKDIKAIVQSAQRARLLAAVDAYQLACETRDADKHQHFLMQARNSFAELAHHYKSQIGGLSRLAEIEVSEGHFVVACLGNAICTSDLGMGETAAKDLARHYADWKALAKEHCSKLLDLKNATRLLDGRYVNDLPAATLIRLLSFAHGKERGVEWVDELRRPLGKIKLPDFGTIDQPRIEFAKALCARNDVLDSYVAHFAFLGAKKVSATAFSKVIEESCLREKSDFLWVTHQTAA